MLLGLFQKRNTTSAAGGVAGAAAPAIRSVSHRAFLKTLVAALGGAVVAPLALPPERAQAKYITGSPSDIVDTNLTVEGNLIVNPNSMAIGTSTLQGKLNVNGAIYISGNVAIGSDGVVKESYYAP